MPHKIQPRLLDTRDAGDYVGFGSSYITNARKDDQLRLGEGKAITGPRWVKIGRSVRYFKEDLDLWLDAIRADDMESRHG